MEEKAGTGPIERTGIGHRGFNQAAVRAVIGCMVQHCYAAVTRNAEQRIRKSISVEGFDSHRGGPFVSYGFTVWT